MGLLDSLMTGKWSDDPEQNAAMQQGLLQFGLNLMSRPGGLAQALGQSGLSALQSVQQYRQQQFQGKLQKEQLADIERRKKLQTQEDQLRKDIPSPYMQASQAALAAGGGPTVANAARMQPVDPVAQQYHQAMQAGLGSPLDYIRSQQKDDALIKGSPGDVFFTKSGQRRFEVPAAPEKESDAIRNLKAIYGAGTPAYQQALERLGVKMTTHQPATSVTVQPDNLGLKPKDRFEMEGKLGDDFRAATKLDDLVLSAASKIKTSLAQTGAVKDQAAIYSFAKLLDPDGAVREADYAAITNTAGLVDRAKNYLNRLLTGEQLNPTQRKEMLDLMEGFERVANERIASATGEFSEQATRYNLRPEAVTAGRRRAAKPADQPPRGLPTLDEINAELEKRKQRRGM